jgi:hypothetical protein
MFIENPLTEEEWADESEWLVERDRLTGRALRAWSHIEHRLLMLLENFLPHPRFDFAGQLWSGGADARAKLDMIVRLGDGHLPERQLDEFHRLLAETREHHARIGAVAQRRACEAYFVEDAHDRDFVEAENDQLRAWIFALDHLARELAAFTARNLFRKGQLAYAVRRGADYRTRCPVPEPEAAVRQRRMAREDFVEAEIVALPAEEIEAETEAKAEDYFVPTLQSVLAAEAARSSLD